MILTEDAARELVADRLRTLQAAYSASNHPAMPRRTRRSWRLVGRRAKAEATPTRPTNLAADHA